MMVYLAELGEVDVFRRIPDKGWHANLYGDQLVEVGSNVRHTGRGGTAERGRGGEGKKERMMVGSISRLNDKNVVEIVEIMTNFSHVLSGASISTSHEYALWTAQASCGYYVHCICLEPDK